MISIDNNNLNSCDHHDFGADNSAVLFKQSRVKFQEEYKGKFSKIHFSLLGFGQSLAGRVWKGWIWKGLFT